MNTPGPTQPDGTPDTCGCCEGAPAPPAVFNRPGQPALRYRIGTHSSFLLRMFADLQTQIVAGGPTLTDLTTRSADDPTVAFLDVWATVDDVLTFYQERIANEGFLRSATERRSVLELARAIGYELSPGVAASTYLAFTLQDAPGSPAEITISKGTKVQSVPPQGKLPQAFETIEDIRARPEWNALNPKTSAPQVFHVGDRSLFLQGTNTQLQAGDAVLIVGDERRASPPPAEGTTPEDQWDFRILQSVTPYPAQGFTLIAWQEGLGGTAGVPPAATNPKAYALRQRASIFGYNAPDWRAMSDKIQGAYASGFTSLPADWPGLNPFTGDNTIDVDTVYPKILSGSWVVLVQHFTGSLPALKEVYLVQRVSITSNANFTLTAKTTHLDLDTSASLSSFGRRQTAVFAQSEELVMAERPFTDPTHGTVTLTDPATGAPTNPLGGSDGITIDIDGLAVGLQPGRTLIISGKWVRLKLAPHVTNLTLMPEDGSPPVPLSPFDVLRVIDAPAPASGGMHRWHVVDAKGDVGYVTALGNSFLYQAADKGDPVASEAVVIDRVGLSADGQDTVLTLKQAVQNIYEPATVSIYGNVAPATHGETVHEVLGSGDGSQGNQRFSLKKPPLTYISAATPSGGESTLEIRVNDVLWQETPSLYGLAPRSENYIVRIDDDAKPTITFGDGSSGERLLTGQDNITATYRSGIGLDGNVDANTLTILQSLPLGVRAVTNPLPASGAASPETLDQARTHAPLKVLTLDRMVSLEDYQDLAAAFAGIGKAQAVAMWNGETRLVHLTVAGADGSAIAPTSQLSLSLRQAIDKFRDPVQSVQVAGYTHLTFSLQATVLVDPRYPLDEVLGDVKATLLDAFSFDRRAFAQPVTGAEVVTVMQGRSGVLAVNLESLTTDAAPGVPPRFHLALVEFLRGTLASRVTAPILSAGVLRDRTFAPVGGIIQSAGLVRVPPNILPGVRLPAIQATAPIDSTLTARSARWEDGAVQPAELLVINPIGVRLKGKNP